MFAAIAIVPITGFIVTVGVTDVIAFHTMYASRCASRTTLLPIVTIGMITIRVTRIATAPEFVFFASWVTLTIVVVVVT